jgi:serine/threonine protein kinase/tetratricopeptide (TPR) repeat protein
MPRGGTDSERRGRLRELFDAAMDLEASERPVFIEKSCEGKPGLRRSLESLLAYSLETESSFDQAMREAVDLEDAIPKNLGLLGRTLGHYRIAEKIGEGGMGEVYRATDTRLGRDVAIKVLPALFTRDPERLARFEREARVLASLNHPNIATIHGIEEIDGIRFLVLELVAGVTLRDKLAECPLPIEILVRLAIQIAEGLAKAHAAGVVHRDLKPDNLMLTEDGYVKILDFGIAKAAVDTDSAPGKTLRTATGRVMGTASYMSPEQARGKAVDHRSDQFSLGSVLFEMVTGTRAFEEPSDAETLVAVMRRQPERPDGYHARVPRPLLEIIERCLAKEPEKRYQSTHDLARDLRGVTERLEVINTTAVAGERILVPEMASIAVMPFDNLGPGDQEYFADGMTDALITHLAKIKALKVISRVSVMQYKGVHKPLPEIARELGVESVLTGSVLHAGGRVRVSTQIVDVSTDRSVWAESYERDRSDILALQSELSRAISEAVEVELDPEVEKRIAVSRTIDPAAHDAYLRGLSDLEEAYLGGPGMREILHAAFGSLERAIEIEPEWGTPRDALACGYRLAAGGGSAEVQAEYYPKAKAAALEAIALDPNLYRAPTALGLILGLHEWKWAEAERYFLRAYELNQTVVCWPYAHFLSKAGRFDEAIEHFNRAQERYPGNPLVSMHKGEAYLGAGRPEEAEAEARRIIEAFPGLFHGYLHLGTILLQTGRYDEAVTLLEKAHGDTVAGFPCLAEQLPVALAKAGRVEEARAMLHDLEESGADWFPSLYVALGEGERAMSQIEQAFAAHRDFLIDIRCSPGYERLMEIPRFREIIDAIGFPNEVLPPSHL